MTTAWIDFLESLGFKCTLDWDDALQIEPPPVLDPADIANQLEKHGLSLAIASALKRRARWDRQRFYGGPLDGQRYDPWANTWVVYDGKSYRTYHAIHVERACWAVYQLKRDGRAIFAGRATSRKKARALQFTAVEKRTA